jgi:hypothetical protein
MVIGMLTILAMLGTTFLLIARMDRRQSEALTLRASLTPLVEGAMTEVSLALQKDLYISDDPDNTDGPYFNTNGDSAGAPTTWYRFVDYAADPANPGDPKGMDAFLWSDDGTTTHLSKLWGDSEKQADTDGDAADDAYLLDSTVSDGMGGKYHVAIRIVDLSSLINVNTSRTWPVTGDTLAPYDCPAMLDLYNFLANATIANDVDAARGPTGNTDTLNTNIALRILDPGGDCEPFAVCDEPYLRNLTVDAATNTGRLFDATDTSGAPLDPAKRKYLTTFNCSRLLVRKPNSASSPAFLTQFYLDNSATIDNAYMTAVYNNMLTFIQKIGLDNDITRQKKMAAHFAANLAAYQKSDFTTITSFAPSGESFTVYGVIPQLVISEAYAYNYRGTLKDPPDLDDPYYGDNNWAYAVELYNPTDKTIDTSDYKLKVDSLTHNLSTGSLASGGRIVIYGFGGNKLKVPSDPSQGTEPVTVTDFGFQTGTGWYQFAGLDLTNNRQVTLVRGTAEVPMDSLKAKDEFSYNATDKETSDTEGKSGLRDDSLPRARATVAVMKSKTPASKTDHKLGVANGLTTTDADITAVAKFAVPLHHRGTPIRNIGEMTLVYLTGPENAVGKDFPHQIINADFLKVFPDGPARGRLDFYPVDYVGSGAAAEACLNGWPSGVGNYPDVPAATLLGEFFNMVPPDNTRTDNYLRIYGRVNINTAPKEVLERLPFPTTITVGTTNYTVVAANAAQAIINYRDGARPSVTNLRDSSDVNGFLTPGEAALALGDYADSLIGASRRNHKDYPQARDALYSAVSNSLTVNSDTYAVFMRVQLKDAEGNEKGNWYYLSVLDRSNCLKTTDQPAVLLFTPLN